MPVKVPVGLVLVKTRKLYYSNFQVVLNITKIGEKFRIMKLAVRYFRNRGYHLPGCSPLKEWA